MHAAEFPLLSVGQFGLLAAQFLLGAGDGHALKEGLLAEPLTFKRGRRWLINTEPFHPNGREFRFGRRLSNGLFIEVGDVWNAKSISQLSGRLLAEFGQTPAQFHVLLG